MVTAETTPSGQRRSEDDGGGGHSISPIQGTLPPPCTNAAELPSFNPQGRHSDHHGGVPRGAPRGLGQLPAGLPAGPASGDALPYPVARH